MYSDPALIRKHPVKLSFSDREADLINAFIAYTGKEKAAVLRELVLQRAIEVLGHGLNDGSSSDQMTRPFQNQFAA